MTARAAICALAVAAAARAHDPVTTRLTWSREISRIVYRRCAACHQPGGAAMSLVTYEEARPWAKAIRDEVLSRRMPPWGAVKGFGDFRYDPSLTQDEINRIADWVEGGSPEGDPQHLPQFSEKFSPPQVPAGRWMRATHLTRDTVVLAIRPLADAPAARIMAFRPDGSADPLLWLHGYRHEWRHVFVYRSPARFEKGTRLVAEPAVPFEILVKAPVPAR